jgi:hypothetical protein
MPMFSMIGSTMKHATSRPDSARSSASRLLYGMTPVSPRTAGLADRWLHRDHHLVVMAVIATLDLDDLLASGDTTGHANGIHRGFGARVGEAPHRQVVAIAQQPRDLGVHLAGGDEQRAVVQL